MPELKKMVQAVPILLGTYRTRRFPELYVRARRIPNQLDTMTGIVLFTAGRQDAYEEYQEAVLGGYSIDKIGEYLSKNKLNKISDLYQDDSVRIWGTTVEGSWKKVEPGDVALVYREGNLITRAQIVATLENLDLARGLWSSGPNWDEENPWRYLVFLSDVEKIDVDIEEFNTLLNYDSSYYPQGFTRVAEKRIIRLENENDTVENTISDLTGSGKKVHDIDEGEQEESDITMDQFRDELIQASEDGKRPREFERLVAEAFSRLGFEAQWIEGGNDTDVKITSPVHAIVEAKARGGSRGISNMNASRIARHRDQHDAEYGFVVGRHFPPSSIQDAEENDLTTIRTKELGEFLSKRHRFGIPPEELMKILQRPGGVQDDRLDQLDEYVQTRLDSVRTVLAILEALDRSRDRPKDPSALQNIILGMTEDADVLPSKKEIQQSIDFLSYPGIGLLERDKDGYRLKTSHQNATKVLESIKSFFDEILED